MKTQVTEKTELTERQQEILDRIKAYIHEHGYSPSVRDVAAENGMNSSNGAKSVIDVLQKKGYLRRDPNIARSIVLTDN